MMVDLSILNKTNFMIYVVPIQMFCTISISIMLDIHYVILQDKERHWFEIVMFIVIVSGKTVSMIIQISTNKLY